MCNLFNFPVLLLLFFFLSIHRASIRFNCTFHCGLLVQHSVCIIFSMHFCFQTIFLQNFLICIFFVWHFISYSYSISRNSSVCVFIFSSNLKAILHRFCRRICVSMSFFFFFICLDFKPIDITMGVSTLLECIFLHLKCLKIVCGCR